MKNLSENLKLLMNTIMTQAEENISFLMPSRGFKNDFITKSSCHEFVISFRSQFVVAVQKSLLSYTHLQPAQVIRFSYWLMNHCEALRQGYQRLNQIDSVHWCPLGSGAIAGNALGIDRDALASELGFKNGPSLNAANSTGNRDAVLGKEYIDDCSSDNSWAEFFRSSITISLLWLSLCDEYNFHFTFKNVWGYDYFFNATIWFHFTSPVVLHREQSHATGKRFK